MFEITDVKITMNEGDNGKLKAFATMTLDDAFVVRDVKIIDGRKGLFVAMPCTQMTDKCPYCGRKNVLRSRYCANCGKTLRDPGAPDPEARKEEYRDIAHPICPECRNYIENIIISAYRNKASSRQFAHRD